MSHAAFLAAVLAAPDDDTPRLVYADWLEERGDPRGEFIRVQCAMYKRRLGPNGLVSEDSPWLRSDHEYAGWCRRAGQLLQDAVQEGGWANAVTAGFPEGMRRGLAEVQWRRGFVEGLECTAAAWLVHGDDVLRLQPVREVTLTTWPELDSVPLNGLETLFWLRGDHPRVILRQAVGALFRHTVEELLRQAWPKIRRFTLPPPTIEARWHTATGSIADNLRALRERAERPEFLGYTPPEEPTRCRQCDRPATHAARSDTAEYYHAYCQEHAPAGALLVMTMDWRNALLWPPR